MKALAALFGKSPFRPLQDHMEKVQACVERLTALFEAVAAGDAKAVKGVADEICTLETEADKIKNDLRSHLPKSMFLPVDRQDLLEILMLQDRVADRCQDIAVTLTLRTATLHPTLKAPAAQVLADVTKTCQGAQAVISQIDELQETGFGGAEADKVLALIEEIDAQKIVADGRGIDLARKLFSLEGELSPVDVLIWYQVFRRIGELTELSEAIGNRIRLLLAR